VRTALRGLCALGLALVLAGGAGAQEKKPASDPAFNFPKQIKLDEKQQARVEELKKEYGPKLKELGDKLNVIMTPELKKTEAAARKQAQTDGKKGKELQQAVEEALKLSPDDAKQRRQLMAARQKLVQEINKHKNEMYTEEQKKQIAPKPKEKK